MAPDNWVLMLRTRYGFFGIATAVTSDMELEQKLYDNRIAKVPPSCVYLLQGTRVCYIRFDKMHQLHGQMSDVGKLIAKDDITVLNFGLHHSPDDLKANLTKVFRKATLHKTMRYNLMFRDSPPQHFDTPTGAFPLHRRLPTTLDAFARTNST